MTMLIWNICLAFVWAVITGTFTLGNVATGFVLGFIVLFVTRRAFGHPSYFATTFAALRYIIVVIWEIILANLRIARDVLRPTSQLKPGIIAVPLEVRSDAAITLLANTVTLTPGTLSIDISADRKVLFVHAMNASDPQAVREAIKQQFEKRLLELMK